MEGNDFTLFSQNLQRSINCLTDQDRNIRRSGLQALAKQLKQAPKDFQERIFQHSHLGRNLMHTLKDPIENNRQLTLNILDQIVKGGIQLSRQESEALIRDLVGRVNATPFPQKSEELRERVIKLLRDCLRFKEGFLANISEIAGALGICLSDHASEIKNCTSELVIDISGQMRNVIGKYSQGLAKSLGENLKNNKYQVRKMALLTVSRLLVTEGAGGNLQHMQMDIKCSLSDSKKEVRKTALQTIGFLLKFMAPKYLKQFEAMLVSCLLMGLEDECPQNGELCKKLLDECGGSIRQLQGMAMEQGKE